ncbi:hypothetical protein J2127_000558 [Methanococcus voltae]|uniref:Uncharacterized protein n=2 Tax=Methanococcus voltae TaxID=2188 RepID=D7DS55_METV3|nr:hypothetical protein [Methanococcus voltae]MBP2143403.1 hypothetical protein [Methanococcus voltae]MBP2201361.1 hypothetical protein [Methanococcus voltae]MCS3901491.1 hypothetical protein [Methanococcus voltae]
MIAVEFNSSSKYFDKECSDKKNNTVRNNDGGSRFKVLKEFADGTLKDLAIIIRSTDGRRFIRQINDVSIYGDLFIITWKQRLNDNEVNYEIRA